MNRECYGVVPHQVQNMKFPVLETEFPSPHIPQVIVESMQLKTLIS